MINKHRVKRLKVLIYAFFQVLLFLPLILAVVCVRLLFAIGNMEHSMDSVASRVESAAVSMQANVKQSTLDLDITAPEEVSQSSDAPESEVSSAVPPVTPEASEIENSAPISGAEPQSSFPLQSSVTNPVPSSTVPEPSSTDSASGMNIAPPNTGR